MAKLVTDELVIRPYWPLQRSGEERTSYSIPCFAVAFGFLGAAFVYALLGSPLDPLLGRRDSAVTFFAGAIVLFAVAAIVAYWLDGIVLVANRQRIVLTKWFHQPTVVAISDLGRIFLCTTNWGYIARNGYPTMFFFTRDGRCAISLYARFRDDDLAKLWAMIGIKPEGSWWIYVSEPDLVRRFPGAF